MAPSLEGLIGQTAVIRSIPVNETRPALIKLLAVENGGIWVESQEATDHWLSEAGKQASPRTLAWFLPFAQISWIMGSSDYPALSEKAFGLPPQ
jgi:hypothetical protein